jgi:hypothetical protein
VFPISSAKEPQQANDVMQLYVNDINKIRDSYPQFFFFSIASANTQFHQDRRDMVRQVHPYHGSRGLPGLGCIHPGSVHLFSPLLKRKNEEVVVSESHE